MPIGLCALYSVNYWLQEFTFFYLLQFFFLSTFVILLVVLNTGVLTSLFHLNTTGVTGEEGTSLEKKAPKGLAVGKLVGYFLSD